MARACTREHCCAVAAERTRSFSRAATWRSTSPTTGSARTRTKSTCERAVNVAHVRPGRALTVDMHEIVSGFAGARALQQANHGYAQAASVRRAHTCTRTRRRLTRINDARTHMHCRTRTHSRALAHSHTHAHSRCTVAHARIHARAHSHMHKCTVALLKMALRTVRVNHRHNLIASYIFL